MPPGVETLDRRLGGGLPRGQISEITGPRSSGRTALLWAALAAATARGELVALVDTCDTFDPVSAAAAGLAMGKADGVPAVVLRGATFRRGATGATALVRPRAEDLFR